ncbi:hypothetical protein GCM10010420_36630 [Streptomyces glaucosporus]|uniref:Uncharacterized protein n=1 Tax=Streptomyces glaucosporus TaxID=284044 RepID=A0ABN3IKH6_9ACTN
MRSQTFSNCYGKPGQKRHHEAKARLRGLDPSTTDGPKPLSALAQCCPQRPSFRSAQAHRTGSALTPAHRLGHRRPPRTTLFHRNNHPSQMVTACQRNGQ